MTDNAAVAKTAAGPPTTDKMEVIDRFYSGGVETMVSLVHPEAVFTESAGLPYSGDWVGPEGVRSLLSEIFRCKLEVLNYVIHDAGDDRVLILIDARLTNRTSKQSVETKLAEVYRIQDGLIIANDIYYKDPASVAALYDQAIN